LRYFSARAVAVPTPSTIARRVRLLYLERDP
jgi:hypothetical protein